MIIECVYINLSISQLADVTLLMFVMIFFLFHVSLTCLDQGVSKTMKMQIMFFYYMATIVRVL